MRRLPLVLALVALCFITSARADQIVYQNGVGLKSHEKATFVVDIQGRPYLRVYARVASKIKGASVSKRSPAATFHVRGVRVRVEFNSPTLRIRVANRKRHRTRRVAVEVHQ